MHLLTQVKIPDLMFLLPLQIQGTYFLIHWIRSCHVMKKNFIPQCCCYFGGKKLHVIFTERLQQVQRGQINFALCSKTSENSNRVMSVFTVNYIILSLFRSFPPLNRNLLLLHGGHHSFCHKFSSSPSHSSLWPALIPRHTADNARMASADGRISGALTEIHLLQEITYMHMQGLHLRQGLHARHPQGELPEDSTITRKTGRKV